MIKSILLAGAVMISVPVLAQEAPAQETPPAPAEQPAQPAEPATPAEQPARSAEQAAPGQQPANATQIAAVVDQGFPTYDKDADGSLKAEEFSSWMVALRSASEPAFKGESAADKQWLSAALTQADKDKSGGVNKEELTTFLTPAAAS